MQAVRREAPETQGMSDADLTSNLSLQFDRLIRGLEGEPPLTHEPTVDATTLANWYRRGLTPERRTR